MSLADFIKTRSPKWLARQPWAIRLYDGIFLKQNKSKKRKKADEAITRAKIVLSDGHLEDKSRAVAIVIALQKFEVSPPSSSGVDVRILRIDDLHDATLLVDIKLKIVSALLAVENEQAGGILDEALIDQLGAFEEPIVAALADIGLSARRMRPILTFASDADADPMLDRRLDNIATLCGLSIGRPAVVCFLDAATMADPGATPALWELARFAGAAGQPVIFVEPEGHEGFPQRLLVKISAFPNVAVAPPGLIAPADREAIMKAGRGGAVEALDAALLRASVLDFGARSAVVDATALAAWSSGTGRLDLGGRLARGDLAQDRLREAMRGGVGPVALANRLENTEVLEGVQKHILPALAAPRRTFGGGPYRLSAPASASRFFLRWGTAASRTRADFDRNAKWLGRPPIQIEDGFIRSIDIGALSSPGLSFLLDDIGAYYDARATTRIERRLASDWTPDAEALAQAERIIALIRSERLSKYNHAPDRRLPWMDRPRPKILLIDQRVGDASVAGGLADERTFARMALSALIEHPGHEVVVKRHPDATLGGFGSYFADERIAAFRNRDDFHLVDGEINPHALFDAVDRVFVVTSGMGFEAALAGLPVECFGAPFYAGWGFTRDRLTLARRRRRRTPTEIVSALWIDQSLYVDPQAHERVDAPAFVEGFAQSVAAARSRAG